MTKKAQLNIGNYFELSKIFPGGKKKKQDKTNN